MYHKFESLVGSACEGRFDRSRFTKVLKHYNIHDKLLSDRMFQVPNPIKLLYSLGQVLDPKNTGVVHFDALVQALCNLSTAPRRKQLELLFKLVDLA